MTRLYSRLAGAGLLLLGLPQCTSVPATNPYDPDTPTSQQQPATLSGLVVPEGPIDVTQAQLVEAERGVLASPNAEGRFSVELAAGRYTLSLEAPAHEETGLGTIDLGIGEDRQLGALRLVAWHGRLAGTVTLADGTRADGVIVSLTPGAALAITDGAGQYLFTAVPVGTYDVTFMRSGFATRRVSDVAIERDATATADVEMPVAMGDFAINDASPYTNTRAVTLALYAAAHAYAQASEDRTFADAGAWQLLPTRGPSGQTLAFTLSAGDGRKTIYVRFSDDGVAPADDFVASGSIVLDTTPPAIADVTIDDGRGFTRDPAGNVTLSLVAWDALSLASEMQIAVDGVRDTEPFEPMVPVKTVTLHNPTVQERKTVKVVFRDAAGNTTAEIVRSTTLDRTAPTTVGATPALVIDAGAAYSRSQVVTLTLTMAGADFVKISNDASLAGAVYEPYPQDGELTWLLPAGEGVKEVFARFADAAGNESDIVSDTISVDTMPPQSATAVIAAGADDVSSSAVMVEVHADGAAEMKLSATPTLPAGPWGTYTTTPQALTLASGEGVRVAYAFLRDAAGNVTVATDTVNVDLTSPANPTVTVVGPTDAASHVYASSQAVTVRIGRTSPDADFVRIATDGTIGDEQLEPYAAAKLVLLPSECATVDCDTIQVQLEDRAGRPSGVTTAHVTLDTKAPAIPVIATLPQVTSADRISISLAGPAADDFLAGYEIIGPHPSYGGAFITADDLDPAAAGIRFEALLTDYACSIPCTEQDKAKYDNVIRIRAFDYAGNRSPEASVLITRDTVSPPAPTLVDPGVSYINAESLMVRLAASDMAHRDATFDYFELSGGGLGATWVPTTLTDLFTFALAQGAGNAASQNTLCVHAVDKAGNQGSSSCVSVFEDSVPPSKPEAAPAQAIANADVVTIELTTAATDASGQFHYEIRTPDVDFAPAGTGPIFAVPLRINDTNEVLLRAVDAAGNKGVAETVLITERSTTPLSGNYGNPRAPDISNNRAVYVVTSAGVDQIAMYDLEYNYDGLVTFGANQQRNPRIGGDLIVFEDSGGGRDRVHGHGFYPAFSSFGSFEIFTSNTRTFSHPDTDGNFAVFAETGQCDDEAGYDSLWLWAPHAFGCLEANGFDAAQCTCTDAAHTQCFSLALPVGYTKFTSCPRVACGHAIVTARDAAGDNDVFMYNLGYSNYVQLTSTPGVSEKMPRLSCDYAAWWSLVEQQPGELVPTLTIYEDIRKVTGIRLVTTPLQDCPWIWGMDLSGPSLVYACYEREVRAISVETGDVKSIDPRAGVWHGPMAADDEHVVWEEVNSHQIGHHINATQRWLATGPLTQTTPKVAGRAVAYLEYVTSGSDKTLSVFDLDANTETAITPDTCGTAWRYGIGVKDGSWLVAWAGANAAGDDGIYCKTQNGASIETVRTISRYATRGPAVSGDGIVWSEYDNSGGDAQIIKVATGCPGGATTVTTLNGAAQSFDPMPVIDGDLIAWRKTEREIHCCRLGGPDCAFGGFTLVSGANTVDGLSLTFTSLADVGNALLAYRDATAKKILFAPVSSDCEPDGVPVEMTNGMNDVGAPAVGKRYLLWDEEQNGRWDLIRYDLRSERQTRLVRESTTETRPAVFDRTIVWEAARSGDPDIFLYDVRP